MSKITASELQTMFWKETGIECVNGQGEPDIDYVAWLESKVIKQSPESEQHPPSESEREKLEERIKFIVMAEFDEKAEYGRNISESESEISKRVADFILSRDKEKDAEIERLKGDIDVYKQDWKTFNDENKSLKAELKNLSENNLFEFKRANRLKDELSEAKAENERLKGEREKHAIGFGLWLSNECSQTVHINHWMRGHFSGTTEKMYTEYLKSLNSR